MPLTVFVSAVSNEFHHKDPKNPQSFVSYRDVLTLSLRKLVRDCTVTVQENLVQGLGDLLSTLDGEVKRSDVVIHLMGDLAGALPTEAEIRRLRAKHPDLLSHEPELASATSDGSEISYTQWEIYLAFHHRSGRLVFLADEKAPRSPRLELDDNQRQSQARHRKRLQLTGEHYEPCFDQRDLARKAIASIERHGLRHEPRSTSIAASVMQVVRQNMAAFVQQIGTQLRNVAKTALSDHDPAGIEAWLRTIDTAALERELDRRSALVLLHDYVEEVRATVDDDPTPANLHELAFTELALGNYLAAIDAARRLTEEQLALMSVEPDQYEQHREQAINAYLLWHESAQLAGNRDDAIKALKQAGALVDRDSEPVLWADIHEPLAEYFLEHALFDKAEPLIDEIIDIREEQGENDPALPMSLLVWCGLLDAHAKYQNVIDVAARAERLFSQGTLPNLDGIAASFSLQASALETLGRFRQAEPLLRRALAIDEQFYGNEHPRVAIRLSNLARLLYTTNRLSEAEPLMRRALAIGEQFYGTEHPKVAPYMNNLAVLLEATNRLSEAESLLRRALAIGEQSRGTEHPRVAEHLNNLALLLYTTNRLSEAESLLRRALAIDEQSYGTEHPNVARDLNNLAVMLRATNRLSEAETLMRRALAIDEHSYGAEHPNVASKLHNLASLLFDTDRRSEAESLMRRALTIDEQSYGTEHPSVARDLNSLALMLKSTNRLSEAEPLMRRALAIFTQSLGNEHPDTLEVQQNLKALLEKLA